jgi:uncharacterized protein (DUF111 family)
MRLHLDLSNGAAGDMIIAALCDLFEDLRTPGDTLAMIAQAVGADVAFERVKPASLSAMRFEVVGGDRPMTLDEMFSGLARVEVPKEAKRWARWGLELLGECETKVHGSDGGVHLHELGTADTFVDLLGALTLLHILRPEQLSSNSATVGCSQVEIAHGRYPNPVPVVATLLIRAGVPVKMVDDSFEYLTPTAALILAVLANFGLYRYHDTQGLLRAVGYGAGQKVREGVSGVLSAYLFEDVVDHEALDQIYSISVHVDDLTGEEIGLLTDRAMAYGALDCWAAPVFGKKSRPGFEITVLVRRNELALFREFLHRETRSPGLRILPIKRSVEPHFFSEVEVTEGVKVRIKSTRVGHKVEFDDAVRASLVTGESVSDVVKKASAIYMKKEEHRNEL